MRVYPTVTISASGRYSFTTEGAKFFRLIVASGEVNVEFLLRGTRVGGGIAESVLGGYAQSIPGGFDEARITDVSGASNDVKVAVSDGLSWYDRYTINSAATRSTAADVTLTAATATQILAADVTRVRAYLSNLASNSNAMRFGDSNVGASRGVEVAVGQTIIMEGPATIYAYDAAAESVGVYTENN
jgi:hypothetical protein